MLDSHKTTWMSRLIVSVIVCSFAASASAVKIGDITHLQGTRANYLVGWGLVVGLNGTGDSKHTPTLSALARLHGQFANPVDNVDELGKVKNVAIVAVEAALPRDGVREGDRVDVQVSSVGGAKSLKGGRLLMTPLVGPNPNDDGDPYALARGPLQIQDEENPTVARIADGATIERDWIHNYIALGRELSANRSRSSVRPLDWIRPDEAYVTFVIDGPHAEWAMSYTIAQAINEQASTGAIASGPTNDRIATAFDPRTVIVRIPQWGRLNPAPFIAGIEKQQLFMPFTEARVSIHRKSGLIAITGDAEISPTIISYKGLTINTMIPQPDEADQTPRTVESNFVPIDPQNKGGAKLTDLVEALRQLQVPEQDRITIVERLHSLGNLHATLKVED